MAEIKFTIPDNQIQRIVTAMKSLNTIPEDTEGTPLFTDNAWAKEVVRRHIVDQVKSWEKTVAIQALSENDIDTYIV